MADLQVELHELAVVAQDLDQVAGDYSRAASLVATNGAPDTSGEWTALSPGWQRLQGLVGQVLASNDKNLTDTAASLRKTMKNYGATEQAATDAFLAIQHHVAPVRGGWHG